MPISPDPHCSIVTRPTCHCLGVHADEIRESIAMHDLSSVRGVTKACGAGGGCNSCHRHIKRMLHEHADQKMADFEAVPGLAFGFA